MEVRHILLADLPTAAASEVVQMLATCITVSCYCTATIAAGDAIAIAVATIATTATAAVAIIVTIVAAATVVRDPPPSAFGLVGSCNFIPRCFALASRMKALPLTCYPTRHVEPYFFLLGFSLFERYLFLHWYAPPEASRPNLFVLVPHHRVQTLAK